MISFGLVNEQGELTNAGALLADESDPEDWNNLHESLLDEVKDSKRIVCYRSILIFENEKKILMRDGGEGYFEEFLM